MEMRGWGPGALSGLCLMALGLAAITSAQEVSLQQEPSSMALQVGSPFRFSCNVSSPTNVFIRLFNVLKRTPGGQEELVVSALNGELEPDFVNLVTATPHETGVTLNNAGITVATIQGVGLADDGTEWICRYIENSITYEQNITVAVISLATLIPLGCWNQPPALVPLTNDSVPTPFTPIEAQTFFETCANLTRAANYTTFAVARDETKGLLCLSGPDAETSYKALGRSAAGDSCSLTTECYPDGLGGAAGAMNVYALQKTAAGQVTRDGVCQVMESVTYLTFDGAENSFNGSCTYVAARLVASGSSSINAGNTEIFAVLIDQDEAARVKSVSVRSEYGLLVMEGNTVTVDGQVYFPPFSLIDQTYKVRAKLKLDAYSVEISDTLDNLLLTVVYDRLGSVQIVATTRLTAQLDGLCGNYNGDWRDDYWPAGAVSALSLDDVSQNEASVAAAMSWIDGVCADNTTLAQAALDTCGVCRSEVYSPGLCGFDTYETSNPLYSCLATVSSQEFIDVCEYAVCQVSNATYAKDEACTVLSAYARACEAEGVSVLNWREYYNCSLTCGPNSHYEPQTSTCPSSCRNTAVVCTEDLPDESGGCVCDEGHVLLGHECIPQADCGCRGPNSFFFFFPNGTETLTPNCAKRYTCDSPGTTLQESDGVDVNCDSNAECVVVNGYRRCVCQSGYSGDGETCHFSCPAGQRPNAMNNGCDPCPRNFFQPDPNQSECVACPIRAITDEVGSINATACYRLDESQKATCLLFGDSHYSTFDDARIDFQGACRYTAVATEPDFTPSLDITVQQSSSMPFVGAVYANLNGTLVQIGPMETEFSTAPIVFLNSLRVFPPYTTEALSISIGPEGVSVTSNLGVTLAMSFDWLLKITIPRSMRSNVTGVCGNYNLNPTDDYTTSRGIDFSSESVAAASERVVNSYKTIVGVRYCPDSPAYVTAQCQGSMETEVSTRDYCGFSQPYENNPLAECLSTDIVDVSLFEQACTADVCRNHVNVTSDVAGCVSRGECIVDTAKAKAAACRVLEALVDQCREKDFRIGDWREFHGCGLGVVTCPANSEYTTTASTCPASCPENSAGSCTNTTEGCACSDSFIWSGYKCESSFNCGCDGQAPYYWPLNEGYLSTSCAIYYSCLKNSDDMTVFVEDLRGCADNASCISTNGNRACQCDPGFIGNGDTECTACAAGQRQAFDGNACETCPLGTFQPDIAQLACDICPTRGLTNQTGATSMDNCLPPDSGTCVIYGDPHYYTFDGERIDFQGLCTYTAVEYCAGDGGNPYRVDVKQEKRGGDPNVFFGTRVTYIEYVLFTVDDSVVVRFLKSGVIEINGQRVTLPAYRSTPNGVNVTVTRAPNGVEAVTSDGVRVWYEGNWHATVTVSGSHYGKVCGIGGNFDGNATNDLVTKNGTFVGDMARDVASALIGNSWVTNNTQSGPVANNCPAAPPTAEFPCQGDMAQRVKTYQLCGFGEIRGDNPFINCLSAGRVDFAAYAVTCEYDVCENHLDVSIAEFFEFPTSCVFSGQCNIDEEKAQMAACGVIQSAARECESLGFPAAGWRSTFGCPLACTGGSVYQESTSGCQDSCVSRSSGAVCSLPNVGGCACPDGQVWSDDTCINLSDCGCTSPSGYWPANSQAISQDCTSVTVCRNAGLSTSDYECPSGSTCVGYACECAPGFRADGSECVTCAAGTYRAADGDDSVCVTCPMGYYSAAGASECTPCDFGFSTEGDGTTDTQGCKPLDSAVCTVSGDPHIYTLDGARRDYMGICTYVLTQNCTGDNSSYDFEVLSSFHRLGGNARVSYVEYVDVRVDGLWVRLLNGGGFQVNGVNTFAPFSNDTFGVSQTTVNVQQTANGQQVTTGFGLAVWFNGRTEARVTVPRSLSEGRVCGLCGNYDDMSSNDLSAPGSGVDDGALPSLPPAERDARIGDSWRVVDQSASLICPDAQPVPMTPCQGDMVNLVNDYCGGLTASILDPFYACTSSRRLDLSPYWAACEYDVCENHLNVTADEFSQTPDCLSTGACYIDYIKARAASCDSLAAAALYCSRHGFPATGWRSVYQCEINCPMNSFYKSETSPCPPTCAALSSSCSSPQVEGCVCNDGFVWSAGRCVPQSECGCTLPGGVYYPRGATWREPDCSAVNTCVAGEVNTTMTGCQDNARCVNEVCRCVAGYLTMDDGSCVPCPAGQYLDVSAGVCVDCPVGTYTNSVGATRCAACPSGTYTEQTGSNHQNLCIATPVETCSIFGDPHYKTYDGVQIDFQGTCRYTASKTCTPDLIGTEHDFHVIVQQQRIRPGARVTFIDYLDVYVGGLQVRITQGGNVFVDGIETFTPYTSGNVTVKEVRWGTQVETTSGLVVFFNGRYRATITVPRPTYGRKLCGLCADCDGDASNDLVTSANVSVANRKKAEAHALIGNSWTVQGDLGLGVCPPAVPVEPFECQGDMAQLVETKEYCGFGIEFSDSPLLSCIQSGRVDFDEAVETCEFDVCEDHLNITANDFKVIPNCLSTGACHIDYEGSKRTACAALEEVMDQCNRRRFNTIGWRTYFNCPLPCGANQVYTDFGSACPNSCVEPDAESTCSNTSPGCVCEPGFVLSGKECVPRSDCGCVVDNKYYPNGVSWVTPDCSKSFVCLGDNNVTETNVSCPLFSSCRAGECYCQDGFASSTGGDNNHVSRMGQCRECIAGSYHDRRSSTCRLCPVGTYNEEVGQTSCDACPQSTTTVSSGSTNRTDCQLTGEAVCTVYGDPHYYTFDGIRIDFQGECRYTASKSCTNDTNQYHVVIKQEKRSRYGDRVTFIQYVEVIVDDYTVRLLKEQKVEVQGISRFTPIQFNTSTGSVVTVDHTSDGVELVTSYGLRVWYEGNWHSTITIPRLEYQGKVCGLCADCDSDPANDLRLAGGELVVGQTAATAHALVGNSFKLQGELADGICPDAVPVEPLECQGDMAQRVQSFEFCGFGLKSQDNPFYECINFGLVDFGLFTFTCEYDVCEGHLNVTGEEFQQMPDCLSTGACYIDYERAHEVACGIITVVAEECQKNKHDIEGWRAFYQCPLPCYGGSTFEYSTSACPNTCTAPDASSTCDKSPVEGCVCPAGQVWSSGECVPVSECGCQVDRGTYYPANAMWTSSDCLTSYSCLNGTAVPQSLPGCGSGQKCSRAECVCLQGHIPVPGNDSVCTPCPAGQYQREQACLPCPLGTYSKEPASAQCKSCGRGFTTDAVGASAESQCKSNAEGVCRIYGDPHYYTFDGDRFDFQGECRYTAVTSNCGGGTNDSSVGNFTVVIKQERRSGWSQRVSFIEYMDFFVDDMYVRFLKGRKVEVNGASEYMPFTTVTNKNTTITVRRRPNGVIAETDIGVKVFFDGNWDGQVTVRASPYAGQICGICGNYDGNKDNDKVTKDGVDATPGNKKAEVDAIIGNSWKLNPTVDQLAFGVCPDAPPVEPLECQGDMAVLVNTRQYCGFDANVPENPFFSCISAHPDFPGLAATCEFDVCEAHLDPDVFFADRSCLSTGRCTINYRAAKDTACESMATVATACDSLGFSAVGWRTYYECPLECPAGMVYNEFASACPASCSDREPSCNNATASGCECPAGKYLSGGQCVDLADCGCTFTPAGTTKSRYYPSGVSWLNDDCTRQYSCVNSTVEDAVFSCPAASSCTAGRRCKCDEGAEVWTNGTCNPCPAGTRLRNNECQPCPVGSYSDSPSSTKCKPCARQLTTETTGSISQMQCIDKSEAVCTVFGDPHYYTFDGIRIDFQGECRYTVAKACSNETMADFHVVVKQEKRKRFGDRVTFIEYVDVIIGNVTVTLEKEGAIKIDGADAFTPTDRMAPSGSLVTVRREPDGVRVAVVGGNEDGISVWYDGNVHATVTLFNTYKDKVCGLCGNYNGMDSDDLLTAAGMDAAPGNSKAEAHAIVGNSFKLEGELAQGVCADAPPVEALPCQGDLTTGVNSITYCGFGLKISDSPLLECILSERVDFNLFEDTCAYDVCEGHLNVTGQEFATMPDCLSTGKCYIDYANAKDVACKAVAVIAQQCNDFSYATKYWRTYFNCPLECEGGSVFKEETSICPDTCRNRNASETCASSELVPGCACPAEMVWSGDECVSVTECGCTVDGEYQPNNNVWLSERCDKRYSCINGSAVIENASCASGEMCDERECKCQTGHQRNETAEGAGCFPCPAGTFLGRDSGECEPCTRGTYQNETGATVCEACDFDETTVSEGSSSASDCVDAREAVCYVYGDPHYQTFDEAQIDYKGECRYTAAKTCAPALPYFHVVIEQEKRRKRGYSRRGRLTSYKGRGAVVKHVDVFLGNETSPVHFRFYKKNRIIIDGERYRTPVSLTLVHTGETVEVSRAPRGIVLSTSFGLTVKYDGKYTASIEVPRRTFGGRTCGLCGDCDGVTENDYVTSMNVSVSQLSKDAASALIGNSWQVPQDLDFGVCPPSQPVTPTGCQGDLEFTVRSRDYCGVTDPSVDNPLLECALSGRVNTAKYSGACVEDVCENHLNVTIPQFLLMPECLSTGECYIDYDLAKELACVAVELIATKCERRGFDVEGWRDFYKCPAACEGGSVYSKNTTSCPRACGRLDPPTNCTYTSGCECPMGQVWSGETCVAESACGCTEGRYYYPVGATWFDRTCTEATVCNMDGSTSVGPAECQENQECKGRECVCVSNSIEMADGSCVLCPKGSFYDKREEVCSLCPTGTYTDKDGESRCKACRHGYITDDVGSTSKSDCKRLTYATCKAYGDPHYYSFDGQRIDFQGGCRYTVASTTCPETAVPATNDTALHPFSVVIQHESRFGQPRGNSGKTYRSKEVTYTKYVDVYVDDTWVRLDKNSKVEINASSANVPFTLNSGAGIQMKARRYKKGVRLDIKELNLYIYFDGNWEATVRLATNTYGGRMCGLCGNADDDKSNDLVTSAGVDVSGWKEKKDSYAAVGNSWVVPVEYSLGVCPDAYGFEPIECQGALATESLGVGYCGFGTLFLDNPLYQCIWNEAVPFELLSETCLYDVCENSLNVSAEAFRSMPDCLSTGRCELDYEGAKEAACAVITVAVEQCTILGYQAVGWRSYFDCPIDCFGGQVYDEYAPPCTKTCADVRPSSTLENEDTCATGEYNPGCVCPSGTVWSGDVCIPEIQCGCVENSTLGEIYRKHDEQWLSYDCTMLLTCAEGNITAVMSPGCNANEVCSTGVCVCPPGNMGNDTECVPCPAGTAYAIDPIRGSACLPCLTGTYQESPGSTECVKCGPGMITANPGSASKSDCFGPFNGHAMAYGDPHYITFDGSLLTFQGECSYVLAELCGPNGTVVPENETLRIVVSQEKRPRGPGLNASDEGVTFVKGVNVTLGNNVLSLFKGGDIWFNGVQTWPPIVYVEGTAFGAVIWDALKQGMLARISFNGGLYLEVFYDGDSLAYVAVSQNLTGLMCGLAGNFDGNASNDYVLRDSSSVPANNSMLEAATAIGNSWVALDSFEECPGPAVAAPQPVCTGELAQRLNTLDLCGFTSPSIVNPFFGCLITGAADPDPFVKTCAYDVCEYQYNVTNEMCAAGEPCGSVEFDVVKRFACANIRAMAEKCAQYGYPAPGWQSYFRCEVECPEGAEFTTSYPSQVPYCTSNMFHQIGVSSLSPSEVGPFNGCVCPDGYAWDANECVPLNECGCWKTTVDFPTGRVFNSTVPRNTSYLEFSCEYMVSCGAEGGQAEVKPTGGCVNGSSCVAIGGSSSCECMPGYNRTAYNESYPGTKLDPSGALVCSDIDECALNNTCHVNADCTNLPGSYSCACKAGYEGDGILNCTNIDECVRNAPCDPNASCMDTPGSYECTCNLGFMGNGSVCEDFDECQNNNTAMDGATSCHQMASCNNTVGSFACWCVAGYEGDGYNCTNIDECYFNGTRTNACHENATCTDTQGSFTCACLAGFELVADNYTCTDVDECLVNTTCHVEATCTNFVGYHECTCNPGFEGNGTWCADIDECAPGAANMCVANSFCNNTYGSHNCTCDPGFRGMGKENCTNIDECTEMSDNCHENASCNDTQGSFTCTCNPGFSGTGTNCSDVDECTLTPTPCEASPDQACVNLFGNYSCPCLEGYAREANGTCLNINECDLLPCNENATCTDTPGSFACACFTGFFGDGFNCSETDRCIDIPPPCDLVNGFCQDGPELNYTCSCKTGFLLEPDFNCTDIDECAAVPSVCQANANCTNSPGYYNCTCNPGYQLNATSGECDNIDECSALMDPCHNFGTCTDLPGSYVCTCNVGFSGNGTTCEDVDECANATAPCSANGNCTNTEGSYTCACNDGFIGNGVTCEDVDECVNASLVCPANSNCTNLPGKFQCPCFGGFSANATTGTCDNIDECQLVPSVCVDTATCVDSNGSFACICADGFQGSGLAAEGCKNIDECDEGLHNCHANATCKDISGSFECKCLNPPYIGNGTYCELFDKCVHENPCDANATCQTNPNNGYEYNCTCPAGYEGNGTVGHCYNVDECLTLCKGVGEVCMDTVGSYECTCGAGYVVNGTAPQFACEDIDECTTVPPQDNCTSPAFCVNVPQTFTCDCPAGYTLNDTTLSTCDNVNECEPPSGVNPCGGDSVCTDTVGSYECACVSGFYVANSELSSFACEDVDECSNATLNNCSNIATCANTVGSFTCSCPAVGYTGDGVNCTNVDECKEMPSTCGPWANCTDTEGSFFCTCDDGYTNTSATTCADVNECEAVPDPCATITGSACVNSNGNFTCSCVTGYESNGAGGCNDINECDATSPCDTNALCTNTLGSYDCACSSGFTGDGLSCADVLECSPGGLNNCSAVGSTCTELPGFFNCSCTSGFTGDGYTCTDIDECATNTDNCKDPPIGQCDNTVGSFTCQCVSPYTGNGTYCSLSNSISDLVVQFNLSQVEVPENIGASSLLPSSLLPPSFSRRKRAAIVQTQDEAQQNFKLMLEALHQLFTTAYADAAITSNNVGSNLFAFSFTPVFKDGQVPPQDEYLRDLTDTITSLNGLLPFPAPVLLSVATPLQVTLPTGTVEITCSLLSCVGDTTCVEPTLTATAHCAAPNPNTVSNVLVLETDKTWEAVYGTKDNPATVAVVGKFEAMLKTLFESQTGFDSSSVTTLFETVNATVGLLYRVTFGPAANPFDEPAAVQALTAEISRLNDILPYEGETVSPLGAIVTLTPTGAMVEVNCDTYECSNGGNCSINAAVSPLPKCTCPLTYMGAQCKETNPCYPKPPVCDPNSDCASLSATTFQCSCSAGYQEFPGQTSGFFCQPIITDRTSKSFQLALTLPYADEYNTIEGLASALKNMQQMLTTVLVDTSPVAGAIEMTSFSRNDALGTVVVEFTAYAATGSAGVIPLQITQRMKEYLDSSTGNYLPYGSRTDVRPRDFLMFRDDTSAAFDSLTCSDVTCTTTCRITAGDGYYFPYCLESVETTTTSTGSDSGVADVGVIIAGVLAGVVGLIVVLVLIFVCLPKLRKDARAARMANGNKRMMPAIYSSIGRNNQFSYYNQGGHYDDTYSNEHELASIGHSYGRRRP